MPLNINLPTGKADGDAGHTSGHNATNTAVNAVGAAHDALETTVAGKQATDADLTAIAALDSTTAGMLATDGSGWIRKTYAQARTALGLGGAAVLNVGTTAGTVAAGDDSRFSGGGGGGGGAVTNAVPLKRFRQALATSDATSLNWWALGDSITESYGATLLDNGYTFAALKALQKRTTPTGRGGLGYISTAWTNFTSNAFWAFSGGGSASTGGPFGSRRRAFAAGETATLTFTGTAFILHFRQGDSSSVPFTVTVDGGSPTTVTPSTTGGGNTQGTYSSGFIPRTAHTVVIAPATGGNTMIVYGASLYDGDQLNAGGLRLYNAGLSGARSAGYSTNANQGSAAACLDMAAVAPNPALVTIMLGTNDQNDGITPSAVASNIATIIANVKAACTITPSIVVMLAPGRGDLTSPAFPWSQYATALQGVADADPTTVTFLDFSAHFIDLPVSGNSFTRGLFNSDQVHPTDAGHRLMAQLLTGHLLGPVVPLERGEGAVAQLSDAIQVTPNIQSGTTYTLALADVAVPPRAVHTTSSSAVTITVPAYASVAIPIGSVIPIAQIGTGQITVNPASGVTINTPASLTTRAQFSEISLRKTDTNVWLAAGDLT